MRDAPPAPTRTLRLSVQAQVAAPGRAALPLSPATLDVPTLRRLLLEAERVVAPLRRKGAPAVTFAGLGTALNGGLTLAFALPEPLADDLAHDLAHLHAGQGLDRIRMARARQLAAWQQRAEQQPGTRYELRLEGLRQPLAVDDSTGLGFREVFADAELYLYGTITRMGGKAQPRIQIKDEQHGTRSVRCRRTALEEEPQNRLYRPGGVHVRARINVATGKIDRLEFLGFVDLRRPLPAEAPVAPAAATDPAALPLDPDTARMLAAPGGSFPAVPPEWLAGRRGRINVPELPA